MSHSNSDVLFAFWDYTKDIPHALKFRICGRIVSESILESDVTKPLLGGRRKEFWLAGDFKAEVGDHIVVFRRGLAFGCKIIANENTVGDH